VGPFDYRRPPPRIGEGGGQRHASLPGADDDGVVLISDYGSIS
jgi:hypothetical protein